VDVQEYEEGAATGGRKTILNGRVLVGPEVEPRDGLEVRVRGAEGRVNGWEVPTPDGWRWLSVGPHNRWSGEV
jgi:hypothetical protein